MAFTYGFYNSINGDRKYDAQQMSAIFDGIITDGVFSSVGGIFATVPGDGLTIVVKSGRAWFDHTWSYNDGSLPLAIETPDVTLQRYDAVVLEVNNTETVRENAIKIVKGTAASTPAKPTLTDTDDVHQHPLAYILVKPGATSISATDIDIRVGQTDCPFATAILETVSISDLYEAWNTEFQAWFEDVQTQLEGDIATNLLNEINKRVKIADKATSDDIANATSDKWVDAAVLKENIEGRCTVSYWANAGILNDFQYSSSAIFCSNDDVVVSVYRNTSDYNTYICALNLHTYETTTYSPTKIYSYTSSSGSTSLSSSSVLDYLNDSGIIVTSNSTYITVYKLNDDLSFTVTTYTASYSVSILLCWYGDKVYYSCNPSSNKVDIYCLSTSSSTNISIYEYGSSNTSIGRFQHDSYNSSIFYATRATSSSSPVCYILTIDLTTDSITVSTNGISIYTSNYTPSYTYSRVIDIYNGVLLTSTNYVSSSDSEQKFAFISTSTGSLMFSKSYASVGISASSSYVFMDRMNGYSKDLGYSVCANLSNSVIVAVKPPYSSSDVSFTVFSISSFADGSAMIRPGVSLYFIYDKDNIVARNEHILIYCDVPSNYNDLDEYVSLCINTKTWTSEYIPGNGVVYIVDNIAVNTTIHNAYTESYCRAYINKKYNILGIEANIE